MVWKSPTNCFIFAANGVQLKAPSQATKWQCYVQCFFNVLQYHFFQSLQVLFGNNNRTPLMHLLTARLALFLVSQVVVCLLVLDLEYEAGHVRSWLASSQQRNLHYKMEPNWPWHQQPQRQSYARQVKRFLCTFFTLLSLIYGLSYSE